jgi:hypothetical protein
MGIIADGIGAAANAGAELIGDQIKNQAVEARDTRQMQLQEQLIAKRAETVAALKRQEDADASMRDQQQYEQIQSGAKKASDARDLAAVKNVAGQWTGSRAERDARSNGNATAGQMVTPSDEMAASALQSMSPAQRQIYEDQGLMPRRGGSQEMQDQLSEAQRIGANPNIRRELQGSLAARMQAERQATIDALTQRKMDARQAYDDRRGDQRDEQLRIQAAAQEAQANRFMTAVARMGSGQGGANDRAEMLNNRNAITSLLNNTSKELEQRVEIMSKEMDPAAAKSHLPEIDRLRKEQQRYRVALEAAAGMDPQAPQPSGNNRPPLSSFGQDTSPPAKAGTASAPAPKGLIAAASQGPSAEPMAPPAPAAPRPMNTIDQIQADKIAALSPLVQQVKQADDMFVAAAKSGDQRAMQSYMQNKNQLRDRLEQQVSSQFGNEAPRILQQILAR